MTVRHIPPRPVASPYAAVNANPPEPCGSLRDGTVVRLEIGAKMLGLSVATARDKYFHSRCRVSAKGSVVEGNGFESAFLKIGRSLYIDVVRFDYIVRLQQRAHQGVSRG